MDVQKETSLRNAISYCIENNNSNTATNKIMEFIRDEKKSITPNLSTCYSLGTNLLLNSNELQDEEVVVLDLTSSGCPYVCGDNFEGFVPQLTNK